MRLAMVLRRSRSASSALHSWSNLRSAGDPPGWRLSFRVSDGGRWLVMLGSLLWFVSVVFCMLLMWSL